MASPLCESSTPETCPPAGSTRSLVAHEPEPKLLGAILLLKARQHNEAVGFLEQVVADHPRTSLAWELMGWAHFDKLNFSGGINDLTGTTALHLRVVGLILKTNTGAPIFLARGVEKLTN